MEKTYQENVIDLLRGFAKEIMADWPDHAGYDGGEDLQPLAIEYGLLEEKSPRPVESCGESCNCVGYYTPEEFAEGITCYQKTPLLLGDEIDEPEKEQPLTIQHGKAEKSRRNLAAGMSDATNITAAYFSTATT